MPIPSYGTPFLIMVIVPLKKHSIIASYPYIIISAYNAQTAFHPYHHQNRQGWIKTRHFRGVGLVVGANLLKMEHAIKWNAKPFTAWGPGPPKGPGQFCILDALWCNLIIGKKNGTEHKP